jgi:hypothetical protein
MTALQKMVQTGIAAYILLFANQHPSLAQAAAPCELRDTLALAPQFAQREPHEFDRVQIVPGSFERTQIVDDVFAYAVLLRVGPGEHDLIRLHRVVREKTPCKPIVSLRPVFLLHGGTVDFRTTFLGRTVHATAHEQSLAVFLAQRNLDVWGLDMRWALIPASTTNFAFMKDWSYATDIHDIAISLGIARWVRSVTGSDGKAMHLMGESNGGMLAYAYVNDETRFPRNQRHVKGLIPIDIAAKFSPEDETLRQDACTRAAALQPLLTAGIFYTDERITNTIGFLAETAPDEDSPLFPGFTNRTVALAGAAAWQTIFSPAFPPFTPFFHFYAGQFDPLSGLPTDFTYTRTEYAFALFQAFPPFFSLREAFEFSALPCDEIDLPYDDHLAEVTVPVLYVGAEGGFGSYGVHTTALLGSVDISTHIVSLSPQRPLDFGHADLLWADNAPTVVWKRIYEWLRTH